MLIRISKIYKACMKLSHTPPKWCEADIIFLAKPDKPKYDIPNSFRPISKFNVILKGLEKLAKWELERTSLSVKPLNRNQHAYSRVYNVDTALVQVVDEAEKGPLRKEFTLGTLEMLYIPLWGLYPLYFINRKRTFTVFSFGSFM